MRRKRLAQWLVPVAVLVVAVTWLLLWALSGNPEALSMETEKLRNWRNIIGERSQPNPLRKGQP